MSPPSAKEIVDVLTDLSPDERETWFEEHAIDDGLRAQVEGVLRHVDKLMSDSEALPVYQVSAMSWVACTPRALALSCVSAAVAICARDDVSRDERHWPTDSSTSSARVPVLDQGTPKYRR